MPRFPSQMFGQKILKENSNTNFVMKIIMYCLDLDSKASKNTPYTLLPKHGTNPGTLDFTVIPQHSK